MCSENVLRLRFVTNGRAAMIWADRLGVCLLLLWLLWYSVATMPGARDELGVFLFVAFVAAPWVIGRGLHFLFTGRLRGRAL
jgi:hypothetical protein